jgi:hypothetical protein
MEPVEAAGAHRPVRHQSSLLQQPQVARYCRPADREGFGQLLDRPIALPQQLDDGPAIRVAERVERVIGQGIERDGRMVTPVLP